MVGGSLHLTVKQAWLDGKYSIRASDNIFAEEKYNEYEYDRSI
jgi:hypothetical protein